MKKTVLYFAMLMLLVCTAGAQVFSPLDPGCRTLSLKFSLFNSAIIPARAWQANTAPLFVKHELPKGAVFCRMEEKLWHKFNIWIKLRAGNDEVYRQLINNTH